MEQRIKQELINQQAAKVKELTLDNCRTSSIEGLTDEFVNLESLSIINCGLNNLKSFPKLPSLKKLDLSENKLGDGLNILSENAPNLVKLRLANNPINDMSAISSFKNLKSLKSLDFFQCGISKQDKYRDTVFSNFPHLIYLDRFDSQDHEEPESEFEFNEEDGDELDDDEEDELDNDEDDDEDNSGTDVSDDSEFGSDSLDDEDDEYIEDTSTDMVNGTKKHGRPPKKLSGDIGDDDDDVEDDIDEDDDVETSKAVKGNIGKKNSTKGSKRKKEQDEDDEDVDDDDDEIDYPPINHK